VTVLLIVLLVLTALTGTAVVFEREPVHQVMVLGVYGLVLSMLFLVLQAPDVALSQLAVGAVALPLLVLLALTKIRGGTE
jgi:energy-converting hydrogenase B subunit D